MEWMLEVVFENRRTGKDSRMCTPLFDRDHAKDVAKGLKMRLTKNGCIKRFNTMKISVMPVSDDDAVPSLREGKVFSTINLGRV